MKSSSNETTFGGGGTLLGRSKPQKANPHGISASSEALNREILHQGTSSSHADVSVDPCKLDSFSPFASPTAGDPQGVHISHFISLDTITAGPIKTQRVISTALAEVSSFGCKIDVLKDGKLRVTSTNPDASSILRHLKELKEIKPSQNPVRGVANLPGSHQCLEEEILEELQQNPSITEIKRMKGDLISITFSSALPDDVTYIHQRCKVKPYYSSPLRCKACQSYGHTAKWCKQPARCAQCAMPGHIESACKSAVSCRSCKAPHRSDSPRCPRWQQEIRIKKVMAKQGISYHEAIKTFQVTPPQVSTAKSKSSSNPMSWTAVVSKSVSKAVGPPKPKSIGIQTTTMVSIGTQTILYSSIDAGTQTMDIHVATSSASTEPDVVSLRESSTLPFLPESSSSIVAGCNIAYSPSPHTEDYSDSEMDHQSTSMKRVREDSSSSSSSGKARKLVYDSLSIARSSFKLDREHHLQKTQVDGQLLVISPLLQCLPLLLTGLPFMMVTSQVTVTVFAMILLMY